MKIQPTSQSQAKLPDAHGARAPLSQHQQLEKQTQVWVAQTFFGTLLKQMHDSPFKSDLFSGGRGGEAFGSLYDQHLAQRMARGAGSKLVHSIVKKIENRNHRQQVTNNK